MMTLLCSSLLRRPCFFSMVTILFFFFVSLAFYTRSEELSSDEVHSSSRTRQKTPESFLCGDSPSRSHQRRELTPFRTRLPRWTCCSSRTHDVELIRYFTLIESAKAFPPRTLHNPLATSFLLRIGDFQERIVVHAPHVLWEACGILRGREKERERKRERKRKSSSHPREQNKKKRKRNVHV